MLELSASSAGAKTHGKSPCRNHNPDRRRSSCPERPAPGRTNRFERPRVAIDTVVFVVNESRLKTYLVQLKGGPLRGKWAFPGGLVRVGCSTPPPTANCAPLPA